MWGVLIISTRTAQLVLKISHFSVALKWSLAFLASFLHAAIYEFDVVVGLTDDRTACNLLMFGSLCEISYSFFKH